ncbi:MAG: DUF3841 domain-containing protein [Sedimentisphaerales bacterium]|nr:DUF3841 domain-containing protein [Sedimentisphaerales bacterium]
MIKLWTIQPEIFYQELLVNEYILPDLSFTDIDFHEAYHWMGKQMVQKGISDQPNSILWSWYKYNGDHKKPDLRNTNHLPRGTKGICIEFAAEERDILLSDFDMWYCVLNRRYIPYDERDSRQFEEAGGSSQERETCIIKSWNCIFDLQFGSEDYWGRYDTRWIQACSSELHLEQVCRIWKFIAR